MLKSVYSVIFMLFSTFCLSLSGLLCKLVSDEYSPESLTFVRYLIPIVLLGGWMLKKHITWPSKSERRMLWIRGACMGAGQMCFMFALQHLSLVECVVLFSTGPLFIPIMERIAFKRLLRWGSIVTLLVTFVGVILLSGGISQFHWDWALGLGLAAGIFNAGSQVTLYQVSQTRLSSQEMSLWSFICAVIILAPMLMMLDSSNFNVVLLYESHSTLVLWALLGIGMLVVGTQLFRAKAYRLASSGSQLAPLIFTNLIFSAIWQLLWFDVSYTTQQALGLTVIVLANMARFVPTIKQQWQRRHALV